MTNQELRAKVAKAMGWRDIVILNSILEGDVVIGYPPGDGVRCRVPDWPNDLPACMAPDRPLEWLIEQVKPWGGSVVLEITLAPPQSYGEGAIGYCCAAYTYPDDPLGEGLGENGGEAICRAVLEMKEKLS